MTPFDSNGTADVLAYADILSEVGIKGSGEKIFLDTLPGIP